MYVYIAARYSRKDEMKVVRDTIATIGIISTSSWLEEPHGPNTALHDITAEQSAEYAAVDLHDIDRADHMLFFSESVLTPRGGRHVEFGYALGTGKSIHVVGEHENIFHFLGDRVTLHKSVEDYVAYMRESFAEAEGLL